METKENQKEEKDFVPRMIPNSHILSDSAEDIMKGMAVVILLVGLISTIVLLFTVCVTKVPKGYYSEEIVFNPIGFAITVATLLGSLATWAALNVFANISLRLKTLQEAFSDTIVLEKQEKPSQAESSNSKSIREMNLKPGDIIIRNFDGKEYEVKEVRSDTILIYTGMIGGYRALSPDAFKLKE